MFNSLVIGSNGFVGKSFVKFLENQGDQVTRFDISVDILQDARFHNFDIKNIDHAYLLAWDVGGSKYLYRDNSQLSQLSWNIDILRNTIPKLKSKNIPFLFVSSQLADCNFVYGITKRVGEMWTSLTGNISVRLWNVYGAYEDVTEKSHVVGDFVTQALTTGKIRMLTKGTERRQLLHIDDVCRGFKMAMENGIPGNLYDLSPNSWIEVREIANIIAKQTGSIVISGKEEGKNYDVISKKGVPGWNPRINVEDGIHKTINLYSRKIKI